MIAIKEFNTIFIKLNDEDKSNYEESFNNCIKLVFQDDVYVSSKDFFHIVYNIDISDSDVIYGDTTYLVLQFDDDINVAILYALNPNGIISVCPKMSENSYEEVLTFKYPI